MIKAQALRQMAKNHKKNQTGHIYHLCLGAFEKGSRTIIGWCGLDGTPKGELQLFYLIEKPCRNRGYAGQCGKKLLPYAFEEAGVPFVNGGCD